MITGELRKKILKSVMVLIMSMCVCLTAMPALRAEAGLAQVKISSVKSSSVGKATIKWGKVKNVSGYQIKMGTNSAQTSNKKVVTTTSASKTVSGLIEGKTYYVRVRAYKKSGGKTTYGKYSPVKKVTIKKAVLSRPSITSCESYAAGAVTLRWIKDARATGYQIKMGTNSGMTSDKRVATTTAVSGTITGLNNGGKYYVKIRAYRKSGSYVYYGKWSEVSAVVASGSDEDGISPDLLETTRRWLNVPDNTETECVQYEPFYWEAGERWLVSVLFFENGKLVACADVDLKTGEVVKNIMAYYNP